MNTIFAHPGRGILNYLLAALASLAAALISGVALQAINPFPAQTDPVFFRLLFGVSLILGPALLYFLQETRYYGWKLLGLTLAVYIGSAQVLAHIEVVVFSYLFNFSAAEFAFTVVEPALTALLFVPLVITLAGRWKARTTPVDDRTVGWLPTAGRSFWVRTAVLALLWCVCYLAAGSFVADPTTHDYYAAKNPNLDQAFGEVLLVQLGRGVLWTLLFVLAVRVMNRPLAEAGVVIGLLFGVFHAAGLLLPNPSMPTEMRLSHLPEIVLSLVMMGAVVVGTMGWRKPPKVVLEQKLP